MKKSFSKILIILFVSLISFLFFGTVALATWGGNFYNPGETYNPECLPSQTNCDVLVPFSFQADLFNYFFGKEAGNATMTGTYNTATGYQALRLNTTGSYNVANGYQALNANTIGDGNIANGYKALQSNTTGDNNIAIGVDALRYNISGTGNIASGYWALGYNTTGDANTAIGGFALAANTTGINNVAIGTATLTYNTTANYNTAVGYSSLNVNITGEKNSAFGHEALHNNTTGSSNAAFGYRTLYDLGVGQAAGTFTVGTSYTITSVGTTDFTLIGAASNEVGVTFTATGAGSGDGTAYANNINGNTAIGYNTGRGIITGLNNTIIGANVIGLDANLSNNVIIADGQGNQRINIDSNGNVGLGVAAPSGKLEIASGQLVLPNGDFGTPSGLVFKNTGGAIDGGLYQANNDTIYLHFGDGDNFVFRNNTGNDVVTFGNDGGIAIMAGGFLRPQDADSTTALQIRNNGGVSYVNFDSTNQRVGIGTVAPTASFQIAQGVDGIGTISNDESGTDVTGVGTQFLNTFKVGDTITANGETRTIATIVSNTSLTTDAWTGANADASYTLNGGTRFSVLGNGNVGIGLTDPSVALDVTGDIEYTGDIIDVSDMRLKENITDFEDALSIINSLQVKNFNMINSPNKKETGFIAQEVQIIFPQAVSVVDPENGYLGVSYVSFIPVLTKAVQELNLKLNAVYDKLETKELCVGSVCVSESQFLEIVNKSNIIPTPASEPAPESEPPMSEGVGAPTDVEAESQPEETPPAVIEPVPESDPESSPPSEGGVTPTSGSEGGGEPISQ